ncbi:TerC family protein [Candidatus Kinetoplastidibacterium crithidiae]|uniref:TerC family/CBS/transporter n=1 Tax=Candidatus Kinetoplastidibacterium crithidiae TCC036E TaxID=1208918 RepID=M1LW18_9PROT|nr:TerC family protein [Candidatus Kinetoplastibacterium crithidii]AFZ83178.1 membrane protein [Candidatus Kinetoplastibacterium crithidii (ex Angomonas deanei ATCC 30255)]AGF47454.1 TerC family/CBS/transporter [Candidatus Kinetoplastibacterium crithidii TCC036E]
MDWLLDPTAWVGLLTLIVLEIVLGIDNLVFIAILVDKLTPIERDKARIIGLGMALLIRIIFLSCMSWLLTLTNPILPNSSFSGRDLIMLIGGIVLLFKSTIELHERINGDNNSSTYSKEYASFWVIVAQIVVLDAVFSLDSVITAISMVDQLAIMMIAAIIATCVMMIASKPLTIFVNNHPSTVVLCLGFLLIIGFSLLAESFGYKIPKGYLYVAIGFSISIEALNYVSRRNFLMINSRRPMRERTAEAVLRMFGKSYSNENPKSSDNQHVNVKTFGIEERNMVSGVLALSDRSILSIMTPRTDISWISITDSPQEIHRQLIEVPHSFFPVCKGSLDEVIGIGRAKDLISYLTENNDLSKANLRDPIIVHESISILKLIEILKVSRGQLVLVADEFGEIEGLVTPIDVLEAIAGEFPDEDELPAIIKENDFIWKIDGSADLHHVEQSLEIEGLVDESQDYSTMAGYLLSKFGELPEIGDVWDHYYYGSLFCFEVLECDGRRISLVRVTRRVLDEIDVSSSE